MKREVRSFWYPTWLAQPAALVEGSRLIDAPPHRLKFEDIAPALARRELVVMHTSTPSFKADVKTAEMIRTANPNIKIGFIGAKVAVEPEKSLIGAPAVDFVARNEFDFTIREVADGRPWGDIKGLSYRNPQGAIVHNENREVLENMDALPWVTPVYKRDLTIENYFGGYLLHPYISFYTGRGCKSRCTFCLWPQTIGGHRYRTRSVGHVIEELAWAQKAFPQVKEFFFDDDTLTDNLPRVEALAREIGKLGIVWSCNAKANVPRTTLKVLKDNGLRLLLVGYESGNQKILHNIKKGMLVDVARRFAKDSRELGIVTHGTFILGLPGETRETIEETIRFAQEMNPETLQVSLASPYPGTGFYDFVTKNNHLTVDSLVDETGYQKCTVSYPEVSADEIFKAVETFYRRYYFTPRYIWKSVKKMATSREEAKRLLGEGVQFIGSMAKRRRIANTTRKGVAQPETSAQA